MIRGDVVVVPFPFQDKPGEKIRTAVVVQNDAENRRLANTILAMITAIWMTRGSRRMYLSIRLL
jgi:mRNA-degrading endonuclease toxin of MazEF toxin-antitoxin module